MSVDLERWAPELAADLERLARNQIDLVEPEAPILRDSLRRFAPRASGVLRRSFGWENTVATGLTVTSSAPYAALQSEGGVVRAKRGWMTIPIRLGYRPGAGFVTVRGRDGHQYIVRAGTHELWATRRREVRIRGSRYLDRALAAYLPDADERVADRLVDEVT